MGTTWKEKRCPGLKAFPLDDPMNEHSVGSALNKLIITELPYLILQQM
ncbi:hypothetical protein M3936_16870 [Sutcliffiella horikoshii]|nr:hypothetical protein [Sutcliffiella horikoshii]MCM3619263.1 hypothetical protein [Sutcliffiella horikoshii]